MAEYSHVNLSELEDQAPNLGADPKDFNIFFGRVPLGCEHCGVSLVRYAPGVKAHGHRHKRQEEIYVLVSGSAEMKVGDDVIELKPWSAVRVPPHVMRGIKGGPGRLRGDRGRRAEHGPWRRRRARSELELGGLTSSCFPTRRRSPAAN